MLLSGLNCSSVAERESAERCRPLWIGALAWHRPSGRILAALCELRQAVAPPSSKVGYNDYISDPRAADLVTAGVFVA